MNFLKDRNGKDSSKRIAGGVTLLLALLICIASVCAYFFFNKPIDQISTITWPLFSFAGICLGLGTALEGLKI